MRGVARGRYAELEKAGVEAVQADITESEVFDNLCQACDAVVHTAAKAGVWGPWSDYFRINSQATCELIKSAQKSGVKAFVYTSSPSVTFAGEHQSGVDEQVPYPQKWLCSYPQSKALAEQAVLNAAGMGAMATCALRPHLIWGLGDPHLFPRVIQRARQGRLRRVGSGQNLIDVVHVQSAARAHVQAVERLLQGDQALNGQALFLTDGEPVECWSWISRILETANVPIPAQSISYRAAYRIGALLEAAFWAARVRSEPPMTRFVAAQLALDHYFSIDRARHLLSYEPSVDRNAEFERCRPWLRQLGGQ